MASIPYSVNTNQETTETYSLPPYLLHTNTLPDAYHECSHNHRLNALIFLLAITLFFLMPNENLDHTKINSKIKISDFAHFYICDKGHHSKMFAANRIKKYTTVQF